MAVAVALGARVELHAHHSERLAHRATRTGVAAFHELRLSEIGGNVGKHRQPVELEQLVGLPHAIAHHLDHDGGDGRDSEPGDEGKHHDEPRRLCPWASPGAPLSRRARSSGPGPWRTLRPAPRVPAQRGLRRGGSPGSSWFPWGPFRRACVLRRSASSCCRAARLESANEFARRCASPACSASGGDRDDVALSLYLHVRGAEDPSGAPSRPHPLGGHDRRLVGVQQRDRGLREPRRIARFAEHRKAVRALVVRGHGIEEDRRGGFVVRRAVLEVRDRAGERGQHDDRNQPAMRLQRPQIWPESALLRTLLDWRRRETVFGREGSVHAERV